MDLRPYYPPRPADARKGDFGRVLVVGGSDRYAGALAFNALAALRAGADLAIVVAPRRAADLVASYGPDLITVPVDAPHPTLASVEPFLSTAHALVMGGGVARTPEAHAELRAIVEASRAPMVLDAESLHALAGHEGLLRGKTALLTPHGGEWGVLMGRAWPREDAARAEAAAECARRYHAAVLVKGHRDVASDGARHAFDDAGSPCLTKGGYGDLVAGVAGAMLARGHAPFDAARVAAHLVGAAGARAAEEYGESTLASDALARLHLGIPRAA